MSAGDVDYDAHRTGYANQRRPDPRLAAQVHAALGSTRTVLNVGAGAGSYEPQGRYVVAVEPAAAMRAQRPADRVPALNAIAEDLPFDDDSFDAVMATMTVHQWHDLNQGLREMRRVSRGPVVIVTFDPHAWATFWLGDYAPELIETERKRLPEIATIQQALGGATTVQAVPIPLDCTDGFIEAYYGRPEHLLHREVRQAQSAWRFIDAEIEQRAITALKADLESGAWDRKYGHLRTACTYDGSLRVIIGHP
jgi:SAM-dependent methyltransferase